MTVAWWGLPLQLTVSRRTNSYLDPRILFRKKITDLVDLTICLSHDSVLTSSRHRASLRPYRMTIKHDKVAECIAN